MYDLHELMSTPLDRCLTLLPLIFYSVAAMAGGGIYVLTGTLIRKETGAAACMSYLIAAISAAFTGMCYAEFATLIPKAGSVYVYTFLMLGELPAFIIGWTTVSDVIVTIASIAKAFSGTVNLLAHNAVQNWTAEYVGTLSGDTHGVFSKTPDFLALTLIIAMIVITATGAQISMTLNMIVTIAQISCLFIISFGCFIYGSADSWSEKHGGFAPFGFEGVINGATIAVFAFSGFDSIANASEETINPKKTIPKAMLASLLIITALYFMASLGMALLVPKDEINLSSPFVSGFHKHHVTSLMYIAAIGTLLATSAAKISTMYIVPRVFYAIACDGLIFRFFGRVEERTQVPQISLLIGGSIAALLAFFINIQTLAEFTSLGFLFSYFTIGVDIMILRYLYDMPSPTPQTPLEGSTEEVNSVVTEKEDGSFLVPLRERFEDFGDRHPFVRKRKCFIMLLCNFIFQCFILSLVIEFIFRTMSSLLFGLFVILVFVLIVSAAALFIYQPTVNEEIYQVSTPYIMILCSISNTLLRKFE